jgi:glutamine synthetase
VEALPYFVKEKNIKLFTSHKVFSEAEIHSRYEILLENYIKVINIEAFTMLDMARKDILPAVLAYSKAVADTAASKKALIPSLSLSCEEALLTKLSVLADSLSQKIEALANVMADNSAPDLLAHAIHSRDKLVPAMAELRAVADELETLVAKEYWPFPTYGELLFNI